MAPVRDEERIKLLLRAVLSALPGGCAVSALEKVYEKTTYEPLDYRAHGCGSVEELLKRHPDAVRVTNEGVPWCRVVGNAQTAHIEKLVGAQKNTHRKPNGLYGDTGSRATGSLTSSSPLVGFRPPYLFPTPPVPGTSSSRRPLIGAYPTPAIPQIEDCVPRAPQQHGRTIGQPFRSSQARDDTAGNRRGRVASPPKIPEETHLVNGDLSKRNSTKAPQVVGMEDEVISFGAARHSFIQLGGHNPQLDARNPPPQTAAANPMNGVNGHCNSTIPVGAARTLGQTEVTRKPNHYPVRNGGVVMHSTFASSDDTKPSELMQFIRFCLERNIHFECADEVCSSLSGIGDPDFSINIAVSRQGQDGEDNVKLIYSASGKNEEKLYGAFHHMKKVMEG